jgi:hypothetical protein
MPYEGMVEWKIYSAVTQGQRPALEPFLAALAACASEAEQQAIQQYMGLMQRCWAADPAERPRFKQARTLLVLSQNNMHAGVI